MAVTDPSVSIALLQDEGTKTAMLQDEGTIHEVIGWPTI